ncbi:P-loop containing nucleoside triphosphate hydrolase protein [Mycena alexandri]|uniref:RNA helicase n=1 Tax=Mycena alexandri TaxID=1745969 RepID=A0AAD6SZE2_9AGAR|nr:P-loop containing nucleoside triphosphate hydrolase protein [Mycena alexandri]
MPKDSNPTYCYASIGAGCQRGERCRLRHDIQRCACGHVLRTDVMSAHLAGKRHILQLAQADAARASQAQANSRQEGRPVTAARAAKSQVRVDSRQDRRPVVKIRVKPAGGVASDPNPTDESGPGVCDSCGRELLPDERVSHARWHNRVRKKLFTDAEALVAEAEGDKHSVTVSPKDGLDFGVVGPEDSVYIDLTVLKSGGKETRIVLETISFRKKESKFSVTLAGKSRWVNQNEARTVSVKFHPGSFDGKYDDVLELVFLETLSKIRFLITRNLCAVVGSKDDHQILKPKSAYSRRKLAPFQFDGPIIRSLRPPTWGPIKWTTRLLEFKSPDPLMQAAFGAHSSTKKVLETVKRFLPQSFTIYTYAEHFQAMLYIEDEQMRQDLEMYSMTDVELRANHPRYDLQVKGLEEGRPGVIVGDFILVKHTGVIDGPWYEGRVHQVHQSFVSLRFDDKFSTYKGTKFDVKFTLNRLPHRRMHQALTNHFRESRILFPRTEHLLRNERVSTAEQNSITPVNRRIAEDPEQLETVAAILNQLPGSPPFVVFGPPGTGKTVTIVEAIHQILLRDPEAHILACAPSNSAADLIARNLLSLGTTTLFRLNSLSRKYTDLPKDLVKFSAANDNSTFVLPVVDDLRKYRVVVSTCISGGVPANLGIKRGHFTHIFCDEAGQATEPEVMLPIKSNAGQSTNVILAGDNKQLGPIVHSWIAASLGLRVSYLSRIMQRDIYSLDPETTSAGSGITIVKLVNNFRSHPAILEFSNQQFYDGELIPCGNVALIRSLENSDELPTKKFPLIFHGILGKDDREGSSPSFFNIGEATLVKKYVLALVSDRKLRVRPEEIGVITPYHAQRCKIMELLYRDPKLQGITVGSVEEFQGQERRVIIMSTVRSNTNYVESDIRRTLGFVANPQRFNVAITRAQALLIVIGNPDILALDPLWRAFLNYIHTRGGWRGKDITWNPDDPVVSGPSGYDAEMKSRAEGEAEEMITRLKSLIVQKNEGSEFDFDISDNELDVGPDGAVRWDAD